MTNDTLQYMSPPCGCRNSAHPCKATCVNTPGSYKCKCGKGFRLNGAEQCEGKVFITMKLETADLVTSIEEIFSRKRSLLCSVMCHCLTDYKVKIPFSFVPLFIFIKATFQ